jgi:isopenicillin N synthase-like dioxygenase
LSLSWTESIISTISLSAVKNHTVPQDIISKALFGAKRFFALPLEKKEAIDIHKSDNFKGYTALLGENTNPENRGDLHEGFDLGWESPDGVGRIDDGVMTGKNVWPQPTDLPGFREDVLRY